MTFIGDLVDGRIVKFGDTLKVGRGDFKATLSAFTSEAASNALEGLFQRTGCFIVLWACLWTLARPLRRLLSFTSVARVPAVWTACALSGVITLAGSFAGNFAIVLAAAVTVALLIACREPQANTG